MLTFSWDKLCASPQQSLPFKGRTCCPRQAGTARPPPDGSPAAHTPGTQPPSVMGPPLARPWFCQKPRARVPAGSLTSQRLPLAQVEPLETL